MAKHPLWSDEYWLLLMQLYLRKPVGVKPLYSKGLVSIALELHIPPQYLYAQLFRLRQIDTPKIQQLWETYGKSPKRLSKEVNLLRKMNGFGQASEFYQGVDVNESWERDFKPIPDAGELTPVALIMILDLYFRLTPVTMVPETPEISDLSRLIKVSPDKICTVMETYQTCDPILNRTAKAPDALVLACREQWKRFGNDNPEKLAAVAAQLKDYFK